VIAGRKRIASVLATLGITALTGSVLVATPASARPDIAQVQARVQTLYHQAEQASERYNQSAQDLAQAQARLGALQADLTRQQVKVDGIRKELASTVVAQYQGQALSSTTQVLFSSNPDAFLSKLTAVSEFNDQQGQMMATFVVQAKQLELRKQAARRELSRIAATKAQLAADKTQIDKKAAAAKRLLSRLRAEAAARAKARAAARAAKLRAARAAQARAAAAAEVAPAPAGPAPAARVSPSRTVSPSRSASRAPVSHAPVSGRAAAAVSYALAQVGKAYVYGAAGPSAFDCSGLTMMAWAQAGVGLPHSAAMQQGSGTPVSSSQLQPGDLVFYYSPVSHVGMYIGNGQIVNAENPSVGVKVDSLHAMPYVGAVRPG
jgi:peptidoglycan DL-endopeptidase CwlO